MKQCLQSTLYGVWFASNGTEININIRIRKSLYIGKLHTIFNDPYFQVNLLKDTEIQYIKLTIIIPY